MEGDYIRRDFALAGTELYKYGEMEIEAVCAEHIQRLPAADVAPVRHGRWEQDADGDWYCTNCDEAVAICDSGKNRTYRKPYCPNCGARMDGGYEQ